MLLCLRVQDRQKYLQTLLLLKLKHFLMILMNKTLASLNYIDEAAWWSEAFVSAFLRNSLIVISHLYVCATCSCHHKSWMGSTLQLMLVSNQYSCNNVITELSCNNRINNYVRYHYHHQWKSNFIVSRIRGITFKGVIYVLVSYIHLVYAS